MRCQAAWQIEHCQKENPPALIVWDYGEISRLESADRCEITFVLMPLNIFNIKHMVLIDSLFYMGWTGCHIYS